MRTLSANMLAAISGRETDEVAVVLVTIEHAVLVTPARFSTDPAVLHTETPRTYKTVSRGDDYIFVPASIVLPDDVDRQAPRASIRLSNVQRELVAAVRSITTPPTAKIELVLASTPDTVEVLFPVFDITGVNYDALNLDFQLVIDAMVVEGYPSGSFDPAGFPGLH